MADQVGALGEMARLAEQLGHTATPAAAAAVRDLMQAVGQAPLVVLGREIMAVLVEMDQPHQSLARRSRTPEGAVEQALLRAVRADQAEGALVAMGMALGLQVLRTVAAAAAAAAVRQRLAGTVALVLSLFVMSRPISERLRAERLPLMAPTLSIPLRRAGP